MIEQHSYRIAFVCAIILHLLVAIFLFKKPTSQTYAMNQEKTNTTNLEMALQKKEEQVIKAVSVDQKEVMDTVNRLKTERLRAKQAEEKRQRQLAMQAESARKQRIEEQKRLMKLKSEAEKLAIARKKALAEEEERLKQLARKKAEEEKRLAEMKKKQEQLQKQQEAEAKRLAELKKQKDAEEARARKEREAKTQAELERKREEAIRQAAIDAEKKARIAGEVDKYKALIVNAISQQWILPDNADSSLSSQFRIRLASDGTVLEVSLIRSSGDPVLDRSARAAIYKASPLPVPSDPDAFKVFRDISLTVRPENARG